MSETGRGVNEPIRGECIFYLREVGGSYRQVYSG